MAPEIAERPRSGNRLVKAPRVAGPLTPVLEIGGAEMVDVSEIAGLQQLACEPHRRHEPVVERAHVLDLMPLDGVPHRERLVRRATERLLAQDVLARRGGGAR